MCVFVCVIHHFLSFHNHHHHDDDDAFMLNDVISGGGGGWCKYSYDVIYVHDDQHYLPRKF